MGRGMELGQEDALSGERIEIGSVNFAPKHVDIGIPEVIGDDEQDIQPRGLCSRWDECQQAAQYDE
jgi:hypothetical protein